MRSFRAGSAAEVWRRAATALLERVRGSRQASRGGPTVELLHVGIEITKPWDRWVSIRRPAMNPAFALAEVLWIVSGRNDSAFLNHWNPAYSKFAGEGPTYYGAYGYRLRRHFGLDQVERAYRVLKDNSNSRQVVLSIWDPKTDLPFADGRPRAPDIPCNVCSLLKVRKGRLEWVQIMRSNDLFLGLPHNIVQFTYLQEMMAAWLGVDMGSYTHFSDSLHLYARDLDIVGLDPADLGSVKGPEWQADYDESQTIIADLTARMDQLRIENLAVNDFVLATRSGNLPQFALDMLLVVAADAARRRGWLDLAADLIEKCQNASFNAAWERWVERTSPDSS